MAPSPSSCAALRSLQCCALACVLAGLLAGTRPARAASTGWDPYPSPEIPYFRAVVLERPTVDPSAASPAAWHASLLRLARDGADALVLDRQGQLASAENPFVDIVDDPTDSLRVLAARGRSLGLRVVIRTRLTVQDGTPAPSIGVRQETDWQKWFSEYRRFALDAASTARALRADLLVIGQGLARTTGHENAWRALIADLRRVYPGPLTYGAADLDELREIRFWDALDLVGLDLHQPLRRPGDAEASSRAGPTIWSAADADSVAVDELAAALSPTLEALRQTAQAWEKPALLTDVGYRSIARPWIAPRAPLDRFAPASETDQALALAALARSIDSRPWLRGALWRGFDRGSLDPPQQRRRARDFSVRGKAAEAVLRRAFRHAPLDWAAPRVQGRGGVVVSSDSTATRVGVEVLRSGGNAIDAAVATALALAVTLPEAGNLGGGGFALIHDPRTRRTRALDFREVAPAATDADFYLRLAEEGLDDASTRGPLAAGIPGTVAGLHALWREGGSLPWSRLVRPAVRLALEGFEVGSATVSALRRDRAKLEAFASTRAIWLPGGRLPREGQRLVQPDLGAVLLQLEREGPGAFYRGAIARRLVDEVQAAGGVWTAADLAAYRPRWRRPVRFFLDRRRGIELWTMGPPSSAGIVLPQVWTFLGRQHAEALSPTGADRAHAWIEALRLAFADRNQHLADPLSMEVDPAALLAPAYLARRARLLPPPGAAGSSAAVEAGRPGPGSTPNGHPRRPDDRTPESHDTTHLVVLDEQGRCVSLTTTLNARFGGGWIAPGTGILLNDQMDDFDTRPGQPNQYGLVGGGVNRVRPGRRMLSSMSPCIVTRAGQTWLALGGRGGPRILSAVAQILFARVVDGWPLDRAVAAPRVHHQWWPDRVDLEAGRALPGLADALSSMGYTLHSVAANAQIHAAELGPGGRFLGVADPRERGLARTVRPSFPGSRGRGLRGRG